MERLPLTASQKMIDGLTLAAIVANLVLYLIGGRHWYSLAVALGVTALLVFTVRMQLSTQRLRWQAKQMRDARLARYGR